MALANQIQRSPAYNGYSYQELADQDGDDESVRLLLLQPALSKTAQIRCHIIHTTLSECRNDIYEHYVALSYVWGDTTRLNTIRVDDSEVTVTENLYSALHDLRDKTRVLRLWADAICINQSDDVERFKQVDLMQSIYSIAKITVIYLGPLDPEIEQLFSVSDGSLPSSYDPNASKIAKTILGLPWFRRVWIFQEFVLSSEPWVQYGPYRWAWDSLYNFLDNQAKTLAPELNEPSFPEMRFGPLISNKVTLVYESIHEMQTARKEYQDPCRDWPFSMMKFLPSRRGLGCTDPRDMIYAHLSFTLEGSAGYFKDGYTASCAEVYEKFAWCALKYESNCQILSHIGPYQSPMRLEGLASWAPDWTSPKTSIPLHAEGPASKALAEYHKERLFRYHHTWVDEPRTLILLGYVVDSIVKCSVPLSGMANLHQLYSKISSKIHDLYDNFYEPRRDKEKEAECYTAIYTAWKDLLHDDNIFPVQHGENSTEINHFFWEAVAYIEGDRDYSWYRDSHQVIDHLMWYFSPGFNRAFFDGRVVARLASGRLALVPVDAQINDLVFRLPEFNKFGPRSSGSQDFTFFHHLAEEHCPHFVTRSIETRQVKTSPLTKDKIGHALDVLHHETSGDYCRGLKPDTDRFLHCILIGECLVDKPHSRGRFSRPSVKDPRVDASKLTIMAIS